MTPELTGYQPDDQALTEILAVSRAKLASIAPGAHIFRVHCPRQTFKYLRALVFYRTDGPARHLVVEKIADHWKVTDAPQKIDTEMPEDLIYTMLFGQPMRPNQTMKPTAPERMIAIVFAGDTARGLFPSR
jgi:hypothetical protein